LVSKERKEGNLEFAGYQGCSGYDGCGIVVILADPANVVLPYKLFLGNFLV
jgi:hypothetical protein